MNAPVQQGNQVAVFQPSRLPYHDMINERFNVDKAAWKALTEAVYPNAKTTDSIVMALSYCRARKLDPFKRPVHIVPMWSSATGGYVETVWPGIAELRTTAFRTGQYAGKDETEFGPTIERTFKGEFKSKVRTVTVAFPEWGRVRMTRILNGKERVFVSPKVVWLETYARWGNTDVPNDMWAKRPSGQLEKCVEAAGLRCTFPEEIGNDLAAEEMEGQRLIEDAHAPRQDDGPPPPSAVAKAIEHKPQLPMEQVQQREAEPVEVDGQVVWEDERPAQQADPLDIPEDLRRTKSPATAPSGMTAEEMHWLRDLEGAFGGCEDVVSFGSKQNAIMRPAKGKVSAEAWAKAQALAEDHFKRIQAAD